MIPLTPENSKVDLATEISNIGRIVVNKCIEKIEKVDTNASLLFGPYDLMNSGASTSGQSPMARRAAGGAQQQQQQQPGAGGPMPPHKKKRLYSLGGNEPIRIHRGRLNRLKTVGTFDLTIEEVPRGEGEAATVGGTLDSGSGLTASTSTAISTSTELFTASSNPNSSSSCLNSPKDLQLRKQRKGGKLTRQNIDYVGTSSESFDKVGGGAVRGGLRPVRRMQVATTSSSLDAKTHSTEDDEDPVTMISNKGQGGRVRSATDSDDVKSPDEVFSKNKSTLSNSSEFKARKSTFKKSKRITRTDSELLHDDEVYERKMKGKYSTDSNDSVLSPTKSHGGVGVMSASMGETGDEVDEDEQADRFSLHGTNLQREYKSDGNALDEVGLQGDPDAMPPQKWMNHSLENCLMSTSSMDYIPPKRESSVDSARGKSETPPAVGKLFENPFSKFKKINKVWKCKKFSVSSGNVRKKEDSVVSPGTPNETDLGLAQDIISPTSVVSDSPKGTLSSSSIFSKIRQQAMTATSSPSSSVASSRSHPRRLFSRLTSISNTELYKTGTQGTRGNRTQSQDISKSNSEINNPALSVCSPFRKNTIKGQSRQKSVKAIKLEKAKNNSAGCLAERKMAITEPEGVHNVAKVQSPLSEEFYNKTGSVRLSAVELFEKFCSSDFSGLYKHEHDPIISQAPAKRYIYRKNSKLLKQRSEPRFNISMHPPQFRFDEDVILNETYYEEEGGIYEDDKDEEEDECMEELGEEFYEDEYYEEELVDEADAEGDEEEDEEGGDLEQEQDHDCVGHDRAPVISGNLAKNKQSHQLDEYIDELPEDEHLDLEQDLRRGRFSNLHIAHRVTEEDEEGVLECTLEEEVVVEGQDAVATVEVATETVRRQSGNRENMFIFERSDENQEVDEIILMPETTCIAAAYPTTAKRVHLHRTEVIYDLNNLNSDENVATNNALLLSVIKDYVRNSGGETGEAEISLLDNCRDFEVKSVDNEDILTIYRICSEENLTVTRAHMSSSKSDTQFVSRRSFQSSIKTPQSSYKRNRKHSHASSTRSGPTPLVTVELEDGGQYIPRSGSNESDFGDMEEDTVRFLCPDSFGSKLSLSLFDDLSLNFSLTLNDKGVPPAANTGGNAGKTLLAPDCDAEDFNLTSEGSVSECVDAHFLVVESLPSDSPPSENNTINDDVVGATSLGSREPSINDEIVDVSKCPLSRYSSNDDDEKRDAEKETPVSEVVSQFIDNHDSLSLPGEEDSVGNVEEEEELACEGEEDDPNRVSKFTNDLQKEFDMLFDIAATKPNVEVEVDLNQIEPCSGNGSMKIHKSASGHSHHHHHHHGSSLMASIRTRISSRHSMQNLEPYEPMMELNSNGAMGNPDHRHEDSGGGGDPRNDVPKTSKSVDHLNEKEVEVLHSKKGLLSVAAALAAKNRSKSSLLEMEAKDNNNGGRKSQRIATTKSERNNVNEDDSEMYVGCVHLLCSRFKKRKSLSMGSLEKSKCFPL